MCSLFLRIESYQEIILLSEDFDAILADVESNLNYNKGNIYHELICFFKCEIISKVLIREFLFSNHFEI